MPEFANADPLSHRRKFFGRTDTVPPADFSAVVKM
jgi:hypothetical protein